MPFASDRRSHPRTRARTSPAPNPPSAAGRWPSFRLVRRSGRTGRRGHACARRPVPFGPCGESSSVSSPGIDQYRSLSALAQRPLAAASKRQETPALGTALQQATEQKEAHHKELARLQQQLHELNAQKGRSQRVRTCSRWYPRAHSARRDREEDRAQETRRLRISKRRLEEMIEEATSTATTSRSRRRVGSRCSTTTWVDSPNKRAFCVR
jgi:hypothetical protein